MRHPVQDTAGKKGAKTQNDGILGAFSIVSESALLLLFLLLLAKGSVEALDERRGKKDGRLSFRNAFGGISESLFR